MTVNKLTLPAKENAVQIKINEIIDNLISADNLVTTNTDQNITGVKTFVGQKRIGFKQSGSSDKLGFTLYNNSGTEKGYLEYNPSNTVDSVPLMTLGNYASASAGLTHVGFRKYSSISGANGAYNLLAPLISDAKTPFNLTTTYTNFYLPLGFTDGTNTVLTAKTGLVNISSLLPSLAGYATETWVGNQGFITGITSSDVTTALGYTPYSSANPNGYQANVIETVKVNDAAQPVTSKAVNISVPTQASDIGAQETLVSGTNIKTVNSTSLLGNGNIDTSEIFIAEYNVTSWNDIVSAYNSGKTIICKYLQEGSSSDIRDYPQYSLDCLMKVSKNTGNLVSITFYFEFYSISVNSTNWSIYSDNVLRGTLQNNTKYINTYSQYFGVLSTYDYTTVYDLIDTTTGLIPDARLSTNIQRTLVSGTDIKTINNTSLLGSGNIDTSEIFVAEYGTTTFQKVLDAYNAGKTVFVHYSLDAYQNIYAVLNYAHILAPDDILYFSFNGVTGNTNTWRFKLHTYDGWSVTQTSIANEDLSNLSATGETHINNSVINILILMYPVGAIFIGTTSTCPMAQFFGTWTLVAGDQVLQGSSTNHAANSTIAASLPTLSAASNGDHSHNRGTMDITGSFNMKVGQGKLLGVNSASNCFSGGNSGAVTNPDGGGDTVSGGNRTVSFKASDKWLGSTNSTGAHTHSVTWTNHVGTTVQPPAYVVNVWRRTA